MKKIDETGYFNHKMLLNMIEDICITFPNIILNKMDYKKNAIRIPPHWKLSKLHQSDIQNKISEGFIELKSFMEKIN